MSNHIYFYKFHQNLSDTETEILNDIYNTPWIKRSPESIFLKYIILTVCFVSILRIIHIYKKLRKHNLSSFIFSLLSIVNIFRICIYVCFVYGSTNIYFHGLLEDCPSDEELLIGWARVAFYRWGHIISFYSIILLTMLFLDCFKNKNVLISLNNKWPSKSGVITLSAVFFLSIFAVTPDVAIIGFNLNEQRHDGCLKDPESREQLPGVLLALFIFLEICQSLAVICLILAVNNELEKDKNQEENQIGKREFRMKAKPKPIINPQNSPKKMKRAMFYLLVLLVVAYLPSYVRHCLILVGIYDTRDYLLDEKLCDLFDCFILMSTSFPSAFCFSLKMHLNRFERNRKLTVKSHVVKSSTDFQDERKVIKWFRPNRRRNNIVDIIDFKSSSIFSLKFPYPINSSVESEV